MLVRLTPMHYGSQYCRLQWLGLNALAPDFPEGPAFLSETPLPSLLSVDLKALVRCPALEQSTRNLGEFSPFHS